MVSLGLAPLLDCDFKGQHTGDEARSSYTRALLAVRALL